LWGGFLADKYGARKVLIFGSMLLLISIFPTLHFLAQPHTWLTLLPFYLFLCFLVGLYTSAAFGAISKLFTTAVRFSGVSFTINIASPVFGSTVPLLATWLIQKKGLEQGFEWLSYYLMVCFAFATVAVFHLPQKDDPDRGVEPASRLNAGAS
jgi:MHS family proline/betaine transporter-like MFS transporter